MTRHASGTLPRRTSRACGFTLIEVLVALAIVTVGMAALLGALSSAADSASYLRDKTFAEWVALNRVAEVRLALARPKTGKSEGDTELAGREWRWEQEVLETEVKGIFRLDVRVRPKDAPGGKDNTWFTTVSAVVGDTLAPARGDIDLFGAANPQGPQNGGEQPGNLEDGEPNGSGSSLRSRFQDGLRNEPQRPDTPLVRPEKPSK